MALSNMQQSNMLKSFLYFHLTTYVLLNMSYIYAFAIQSAYKRLYMHIFKDYYYNTIHISFRYQI